MAIFKKDKKSDEAKEDKNSSIDIKKTNTLFVEKSGEMEYILTKPHITEKASMHAENSVYVFQVSKKADKTLVMNAVSELYKVEPIKVNIVNLPAKAVSSKGIKGMKTGKKKALVFLKKGDTIEII